MSFTATGGPGPIPPNSSLVLPTSAGQMFQAIAVDLSGGVNQFEQWIQANPDDSTNIAYWHRADAVSLSNPLLAYMQTSVAATPPGLGLSSGAANAKLTELLALAATEPR